MAHSPIPLDVVDELRLRRWARENYVSSTHRNLTWHPVVLAEMESKDGEMQAAVVAPHDEVGPSDSEYARVAGALVPLHPGAFHVIHAPHMETEKTRVLLQVPQIKFVETP